jgi:hypothetical protein
VLVGMTPEQAKAEQAEEIHRLEAGDMSDAKADERMEALRKAAVHQQVQADRLRQALRLANASGCPDGTPPMQWLLDCGLAVKDGESYRLIAAKAKPTNEITPLVSRHVRPITNNNPRGRTT